MKRLKQNIQRPVLDALRGSLHRFRTMRGTIITRFSEGTVQATLEPGGAPITLIDRKRLVELLVQHGIGIKRETAELWELDASRFEEGSADETDDDGDDT